MQFTDPVFLFTFLPLVLGIHRLLVHRTNGTYGLGARGFLFLSTLVFYGYTRPRWLVPFFICIAFDLLWAKLLFRVTSPRRKWFLLASVVQNVALLGFLKYGTWLRRTLGPWVPEVEPLLNSLGGLPPGLSFYTFESLSFVIDIYRRQITTPPRLRDFFPFIGMFPRFVAGPIVRYSQVADQFLHYRGPDWEGGLFLFLKGFVYKSLFADSFQRFVAYAFEQPVGPAFAAAWVGAFAFTFQIYFDFAGYSLMALGLGRCLGFRFPDNFNAPYASHTLQEFWRRWHITLSTWFRDYVYIPLGGSRRGALRTYFNLFVTFLLSGLWHGANVTFLCWGALHGCYLCVERFLSKRFGRELGNRWVTFLFVVLAFVVFRAPTVGDALDIWTAMVNPSLAFNPDLFGSYPLEAFLSSLGILYALVWEPMSLEGEAAPPWKQWTLFAGALLGVLLVVSHEEIPFIYFRF